MIGLDYKKGVFQMLHRIPDVDFARGPYIIIAPTAAGLALLKEFQDYPDPVGVWHGLAQTAIYPTTGIGQSIAKSGARATLAALKADDVAAVSVLASCKDFTDGNTIIDMSPGDLHRAGVSIIELPLTWAAAAERFGRALEAIEHGPEYVGRWTGAFDAAVRASIENEGAYLGASPDLCREYLATRTLRDIAAAEATIAEAVHRLKGWGWNRP